jgi:putative ABC transport system permease protein
LGRGFLPQEELSGAAPVILVSHGFWQRYLGSDPAAVGRTITLDARIYTVIGVMPAGFRTQFRAINNEYWTTHVEESTRALELEAGYELVARLAPDVSVQQARRELAWCHSKKRSCATPRAGCS